LENRCGYTATHLAAARAILPTYTKLSRSLAQKVRLRYFPERQNLSRTQQMATDMAAFGIIAKAPPPNVYVKPNPVR
jgi:hypothetical protein